MLATVCLLETVDQSFSHDRFSARWFYWGWCNGHEWALASVSERVAMISGFLKTGTFTKDHVHVFDISEARMNYFTKIGIIVNNSIQSLVDACDIIVLAVKVAVECNAVIYSPISCSRF